MKSNLNYAPLILACILSCISCMDNTEDPDENSSLTIKINDQEWMVGNLNTDKFRNGDLILEAKSAEDWNSANFSNRPAWCYYDFNPENGTKYGKLYNWYAVNDPRGLAPVGHHIPSEEEWTSLVDFLGGKSVAGTKMKSKSGWYENGNGTNQSGFTGIPAGQIRGSHDGGIFSGIGSSTTFWSSTEFNLNAYFLDLTYFSDAVTIRYSTKSMGYSVRCIKD